MFAGPVRNLDNSLTPMQRAGKDFYTCVPRGNGRRLGIDRDADGILDGDE